MQTIRGGWVGQTFALATHNDSGGRKSRIRLPKEERKTLVETFIKKYQETNNGNFPSLTRTHKEVGGSFYTVRELVREVIQENRVLGPAKLSPEEQNNVKFAELYPLGSISTEPQSLSLSGETHVISTSAPNHYVDKSEEADFGVNTQLGIAELNVVDGGLQTSTSNIYERIKQSDESSIINSESDHQENKDEVLYSSGINGLDHKMLNEPMVGDYETTKETEISGKSDLLDDLSLNHQNTNAQVLDSTEVVSELVNESLIGEAVTTHAPVKKDETFEESISTESVARDNLVVESGQVEQEASKAGIPLKTTELVVGEAVATRAPVKKDETFEESISAESVARDNLVVESGQVEQEASKAGIPLKTTELVVEKFPLRPISKKINDLDARFDKTTSVAKTSEETEHEGGVITSSENAAQLVNEPVDGMIADPTSENSSKLLDEKTELKAGESSFGISSASEERAAITIDIVAKASSTVNGTVDASNPSLNEIRDNNSQNGSSMKAASDELIEAKGNSSVQHGSSQQKGGNPPLDRINLETWKDASAKSKKRETNPLLILLKACVTAFVKFWTEE